MIRQLIRPLLHSFCKGKDFYGRKTVGRPISNLRKSRILNSSIRTRILSKEVMPKIKSGFYAVRFGHKPGVYQSWEECEKQVKKYPGAKYKKFATFQEAEAFVKEGNKKVELFLENPTQETSTSLRNSSKQYSTPSSPVHSPTSNGNDGKLLRVWTDGSSHNNGKPGARAGVGVYWGKNDPRNVSERLPGKQTNNRAEVMAVIRALETCPDNNIPLEIRTDSQFTINAFTSWIPKWEKDNKWKTKNNKDVEHKELFQRLMKLVRARNAKVTIKYVPGHASVKENEEADRLANMGAMLDAVDDPYNYDNDERSEITGESSFLETSEILEIEREDLDYPLAKDDFFSSEEKLEMENETGMKFV